jgi:hypothetical protein
MPLFPFMGPEWTLMWISCLLTQRVNDFTTAYHPFCGLRRPRPGFLEATSLARGVGAQPMPPAHSVLRYRGVRRCQDLL